MPIYIYIYIYVFIYIYTYKYIYIYVYIYIYKKPNWSQKNLALAQLILGQIDPTFYLINKNKSEGFY